MDRALYVYAIVRSDVRLPRIAGHRIERVELGGVAAAAERRTKAGPLSEKSLRDQYRVIARLHARVDAILPVRFGALVNADELARIVALRRRTLVAALRNVRNRSQMTVRLIGSPIEPAPGPGATTGTEYLLARVESSRPALPPAAETIRRSVARLVAAESIERGRGSIALTLHHLVANDRLERYRARLEDAAVRSGLQTSVVIAGPTAPFAFVPDLWNDA